jgi:squalene-hopene/tetraprenyl-beta-curcumene cyclase
MKKSLCCLLTFALAATLMAAEAPSHEEIVKSITKGLAYLEKQQQPDGSFANPENKATSQDHPALTALPVLAFQRDPSGNRHTEVLQKAYAFIRSKAQPDGGIYGSGLSNYNTSVCMMALLGSGDPKDEPLITRARAFVAGQQASNMAKPENNGGFGYGPVGTSPKRQHPDLDNTLVALEALHEYRLRRPQTELAKDKDLDFKAAIDFISRCQNLPATNPLPNVNGDAANKGGFVYYPGYSNAGEEKLPDGRTALRSYGSMSYAGLLSFIYADLDKSDQRVVAALDWLSKNYTLEENPALGRQGIFYYYNLAARGLKAAGVDKLTTAKGEKVDWRAELSRKILSLQNADGSWVNDQARWMEKDPVLVTSYCVMALENILAK